MLNHFKFREKYTEPQVEYGDIADGIIRKRDFPGCYEYEKCVTINGIRYFITFDHFDYEVEEELSIHFGLTETETNPITNAGLEVFGKIADEIALMYEEIIKKEKIKQIKIHAAIDSHSKNDLEKVNEIIAENPSKLEGHTLTDENQGAVIEIKNGFAYVKFKNRLGLESETKIAVTPTLLNDIKHMTKVDISEFLPYILNVIKYKDNTIQNKKQVQRLKLYQFYLKKRFPQFTFNSKTVVKDGKPEIEFEKDENDEPYLLVATNN